MTTAAPAGLEAMLLRPSGSGRYPLALISHGAPRDQAARPNHVALCGVPAGDRIRPARFCIAGRDAARLRDFRRRICREAAVPAAVAIICGRPRRRPRIGGRRSRPCRTRSDVSTNGMIAVGVSAGGFASVALAAAPPPGLAAAISFAGGRGSRADDDVCDEARWSAPIAALGRTSRIPMLWIYAENDKFFRPDLAHRMHAAFTGAGGRAQLIDAPAFGDDGHTLFSRGIPLWTPDGRSLPARTEPRNAGACRRTATDCALAATPAAREGPISLCGLSGRQPAQGIRGVADRQLRLARRATIGGGGARGGACRMRQTGG